MSDLSYENKEFLKRIDDEKMPPCYRDLVIDSRNLGAFFQGTYRVARGTLPKDMILMSIHVDPSRGWAWVHRFYSQEWTPIPFGTMEVPALDYAYDVWDEQLDQWRRFRGD